MIIYDSLPTLENPRVIRDSLYAQGIKVDAKREELGPALGIDNWKGLGTFVFRGLEYNIMHNGPIAIPEIPEWPNIGLIRFAKDINNILSDLYYDKKGHALEQDIADIFGWSAKKDCRVVYDFRECDNSQR